MHNRRGAFRRFMTVRIAITRFEPSMTFPSQFSYLLAMPLMLIYTVGNTVIKYQEGFVTLSDGAGSLRLLRYTSLSLINHRLSSVPETIRVMDSPSPSPKYPAERRLGVRVGYRYVRLSRSILLMTVEFHSSLPLRISHLEGKHTISSYHIAMFRNRPRKNFAFGSS